MGGGSRSTIGQMPHAIRVLLLLSGFSSGFPGIRYCVDGNSGAMYLIIKRLINKTNEN